MTFHTMHMTRGVAIVAEDEPLIASMIHDALVDAGLTVLEAQNGDEALRLMRECVSVDLLVTDLEMPPGMGGRELIRHVRDRSAGTKVIVASANAHMLGPDEPADVALTKPYSLTKLVNHALELIATPANR